MRDIKSLVRPNILSLKPYSSARDEFKGEEGIFLDANENPYGVLNRYPDPLQSELKAKVSRLKEIGSENIFIGNGSDEIIDLALRIFCTPGKDAVIVCPPTYGMYEVSAQINDIDVISIPLNDDFQLNEEEILNTEAKMIFLCSPNNPTGNSLDGIERIVQNFKGIVFLDEAYIDFSERASFLQRVNEYTNLIVSQTLSKAWGRAAIRVGFAFADTELIGFYNKVKPPYNISFLNQQEAIASLAKAEDYVLNKETILNERECTIKALSNLDIIQHIYPSDANFVLVKVKNANVVYKQLIARGVVVRNRHQVVNECLRISIGRQAENATLIKTLKNIKL